ncbi:MAG: hypothetical protein PHW14_07460, partial [Candidatus Omnitrophica bacterium]|nr:hypothetical protein [Candidatus Omnitrophota bacterium]
IPQGGVLMAEGKVCRNQAFKLGPRAYGLQFHLEVDGEMIKKWAKEYLHGPVRDIERRTEEMLNGYYAVEKKLLRQLRRLCSNFRRIMDGPGSGEEGS